MRRRCVGALESRRLEAGLLIWGLRRCWALSLLPVSRSFYYLLLWFQERSPTLISYAVSCPLILRLFSVHSLWLAPSGINWVQLASGHCKGGPEISRKLGESSGVLGDCCLVGGLYYANFMNGCGWGFGVLLVVDEFWSGWRLFTLLDCFFSLTLYSILLIGLGPEWFRKLII